MHVEKEEEENETKMKKKRVEGEEEEQKDEKEDCGPRESGKGTDKCMRWSVWRSGKGRGRGA